MGFLAMLGILNSLSSYQNELVCICVGGANRDESKMDEARILVRTNSSVVLNETFNIKINGNFSSLKVVKDAHGPIRICVPSVGHK